MALALRATLEETEHLKKVQESVRGNGDVQEVEGESLPQGRPVSF